MIKKDYLPKEIAWNRLDEHLRRLKTEAEELETTLTDLETRVDDLEETPTSGIESISGATVDNTDPSNPIVNTPNLQQVTEAGNSTTYPIRINDAMIWSESGTLIFGDPDNSGGVSTTIIGNRFGAGYFNANNITLIGALTGSESIGNSTTIVGSQAGMNLNNLENSTLIGVGAGRNAGTTSRMSRMLAVGNFASMYNSGKTTTAFGDYALYNNTGNNCTAVGTKSLTDNAFNNVIGLSDSPEVGLVIGSSATADKQIVFGINNKNIRFNGDVADDKLFDFPAANTGTLALTSDIQAVAEPTYIARSNTNVNGYPTVAGRYWNGTVNDEYSGVLFGVGTNAWEIYDWDGVVTATYVATLQPGDVIQDQALGMQVKILDDPDNFDYKWVEIAGDAPTAPLWKLERCYVKGTLVTDTLDGNVYVAIQDVGQAGTHNQPSTEPLFWEALAKTNAVALKKDLSVARASNAVTLAVNTARTPSADADVEVIVTFEQTITSGQSATGNFEMDTTGDNTFVIQGEVMQSITLIGITATQRSTITKIVPKGSQYKWTVSGTGTTTVVRIVETIL